MTDGHDVERIVSLFRTALWRKLHHPKNLAKTSWLNDTDESLLLAMNRELVEARQAIDTTLARVPPSEQVRRDAMNEVLSEAADVAAFAAMLCDPRRLGSAGGIPLAETVEPEGPLCPVCGEPVLRHFVTRWYGDKFDVWSERMASDGMTCFVIPKRTYPRDERERPHAPAVRSDAGRRHRVTPHGRKRMREMAREGRP